MSLTSNMEEDIQNYSPALMFRGTPCTCSAKKQLILIFTFCRILIYIQEITTTTE